MWPLQPRIKFNHEKKLNLWFIQLTHTRDNG